jgi:hypothetical protein
MCKKVISAPHSSKKKNFDQLLVLAHYFTITMGGHLQGEARLLAWCRGNGNVMGQNQKFGPKFVFAVMGGRYNLPTHGNEIFSKLAQPYQRKMFLRVL